MTTLALTRAPAIRWRVVAIAVVVGAVAFLNLMLLTNTMLHERYPLDWNIWTAAGQRALSGLDLYAVTAGKATADFRWSPLAAWLAVPIGVLGVTLWQALHIAALGLLRDWRLIALVAVSWPFWYDFRLGNLLTFAFVAAVLALRGSRWATAAYLGLCLLVPRPVMAPVALWLLWQRPAWRLPFVLAGLAELGAVAAMGDLRPWLATLLSSGSDMTMTTNVGPSRFVGTAWLLVGLPLAAWLTYRGRLGLASLAISPYVFPYYLLFGLLELVRPASARKVRLDLAEPEHAASYRRDDLERRDPGECRG